MFYHISLTEFVPAKRSRELPSPASRAPLKGAEIQCATETHQPRGARGISGLVVAVGTEAGVRVEGA